MGITVTNTRVVNNATGKTVAFIGISMSEGYVTLTRPNGDVIGVCKDNVMEIHRVVTRYLSK